MASSAINLAEDIFNSTATKQAVSDLRCASYSDAATATLETVAIGNFSIGAVMKITLSIDSAESIEIGYFDLVSIIRTLDDEPRHSGFFAALASHPASKVRCAVAFKSCLPVGLLEKLARDESIEVVREVASNETALNLFDQPMLQAMIDRDVGVASELADNLFMVNGENLDGLVHSLMRHPDPLVAAVAADFDSSR